MSYKKKPGVINPEKVDPSVYYYDEVYDEMKDEEETNIKEQRDSRKARDIKSKYIDGLKETAEQRKTDKEIRKFKKYARDREEAEENDDIPSEGVYITSAYRKKLKEIEKLESEKRRRIENEKSSSMNFIRRESSRSETKGVTENKKCSIEVPEPAPSSSRDSDKTVDRDYKSSCVHKDNDNMKTPRRPLKTMHDRRAYLREILAKRTVGKFYDEAVQRYIERKAQSQR